MFSSNDLNVKLVYMGFGGLIAIIGMLLLVAAKNDKFDTIQCRRLEIVDTAGEAMVILGIDEGGAGLVEAFGKDGKSGARLYVHGYGGGVFVWDKGGESAAWLCTREHGGLVDVRGKGEGRVAMTINEYGNGTVTTWDKNGYKQ